MIQCAAQFYKEIQDSMISSTKKIILTKDILVQLESLFTQFSGRLNVYIDSFNKMIMKDIQGEDERLIKSFQIFSNSLLKISETFKKLSSNTKNAIIQPFGMFIENYRDTNRNLARKVSDLINQLNNNKREIESIKQNSYQSWVKADKGKAQIQKVMDKMGRGGKSLDMSKINENSYKLAMNAEKVEEDYKSQVQIYNQKWKQLEKEFEGLCVLYEYNQEARLSFEKITFTTALRCLVEAGLIENDIDKKIQESEELLKANSVRTPLFQIMKSKPKFDVLFQESDKEIFISYDDFKREKFSKKENQDPYKIITLKEREDINQLIQIWLNQNQLIKISKPLDNIKMQVISNNLYSRYFIDVLENKLRGIGHYYCKIEPEHFNDMLNVLILISRALEYENQKEHTQLYKVMNISLRLLKKSKSTTNLSNNELLSSSLGKNSKIFSNQDLWISIFKLIRLKYNSKPQNSIIKSGLAFLNKIGDFMTGRDEEKQEVDYFHSVKELTILMSSLSVPTQFSIPFIKKLLQKREQAFEVLKNILYNKHDFELRQRLVDPKEIIKHKQNKQLAIYHSKTTAQACLKILSKTGLLDRHDAELRLVCKQLKDVHKQIYHRLDIPHKWLLIMGCHVKDYETMKQSIDQKDLLPSVQQIITLDVNRSLHLHSQYLSPAMLHTLLSTFSYFNKEISYCQGMNYIAGYLFIKTKNQAQSYSLFEKMMLTHFKELFLHQFQFLKIKMYQFERLMAIFLPEISDHFKRQMISSECYIVSWIIALYSATYQYCLESYLVDYLWDKFIAYGWKQFFKFTLWIFSLYKSQLLDLSFDRVLHFLGDLTKTQLFVSREQEIKKHPKIVFDEIEHQINKFKISNKLLELLKKDYEVTKKLEEK